MKEAYFFHFMSLFWLLLGPFGSPLVYRKIWCRVSIRLGFCLRRVRLCCSGFPVRLLKWWFLGSRLFGLGVDRFPTPRSTQIFLWRYGGATSCLFDSVKRWFPAVARVRDSIFFSSLVLWSFSLSKESSSSSQWLSEIWWVLSLEASLELYRRWWR